MSIEPSDEGPRPPRPPAGWRIGRYRVESVLGTGAFATVYRAIDERLDDTVAIKVLAENHSLDPEIRKRFLTEGRVLRRIDSPHVLGVHDLGETDRQQPFLVLEFATRGTLAQRALDLRARGWSATPADLLAVAGPLALALDAIHRTGVVHRDINPGNVLLTTRGLTHRGPTPPATVVGPDERPVLADLGLCKDLALHSGHTSAGGTEGFRPPELRTGPAIIDHRADLWSLSALLVWLATGTPPDGTPLAPALTAAGLPTQLAARLATALDRGLADDPHHRHPDAPTWLSDIHSALTPTDLRPPPPRHATPPPSTPPPPPLPAPLPKDWTWRLRHSAWVLTALPVGLTTWAGFLYIGLRARRAAWLWAAGAYGFGLVLFIALAWWAPVDETGQWKTDAWQANAATATLLILWLAGLVHALLANRQWLHHRSSPDPLQGPRRWAGGARGWGQ